MSIVFAASEVGSVRALLPVCRLCSKRGFPVSVFNIGHMSSVSEKEWNMIDVRSEEEDELSGILMSIEAELLVFSVNVKDRLPLKVARVAEKLKIPTIHILDYWNSYLGRMELDNKVVFKPTVYVVPDEYAKQKAILDGVDKEIIQVLGQPAFADWFEQYEGIANVSSPESLQAYGFDPVKKLVIFVSEPVSNDQGRSLTENSQYRGYTEKDALTIFASALSQSKEDCQACILPHPREDGKEVEKLWHSLGGDKLGKVVSGVRGRDLMPHAYAVVGMASTLLYEAWLLGIPVLSIQPNLRNDSLRMIAERHNVCLIEKSEGAEVVLLDWLCKQGSMQRIPYYDEMELHRHSVEKVFQLIQNNISTRGS